MPAGIYSDVRCTGQKSSAFVPTPHQRQALEAFLQNRSKGMLLYHKLGSGKTCTSILIADRLLQTEKVNRIFILTPGSLRAGWVTEYCQVCGDDKETLKSRYTFITYNYRVGSSLPNFNGSLVIIDEIHNLINGVRNESTNPMAVYNAVKDADCRLLALSGTPVFENTNEFWYIGKLLKPNKFPDSRNDFDLLFWSKEDGSLIPKNPTRVKRLLENIVSYYPGSEEKMVPKIIEMPPVKAQMTLDQETYYWEEQRKEDKLAMFPPSEQLRQTDPRTYELLRDLHIMAKRNIISRSAANMYYPEDIKEKPDLLSVSGGWITHNALADRKLAHCSSKITALILNIMNHFRQKHVLFTFFKQKAGAYLIQNLFALCDITVDVFSGDLDDVERRRMLKRFNSIENRYGDLVKLLIVTEAGSEGISILEARHMHILESSPRASKITQAIGRVARYKSHIRLPPDEQNVTIWRYWATCSPLPSTVDIRYINNEGKEISESELITDKTAIDERLYLKGQERLRKINSFLDLLKTYSVTSY